MAPGRAVGDDDVALVGGDSADVPDDDSIIVANIDSDEVRVVEVLLEIVVN
jgi:hypothetical protein